MSLVVTFPDPGLSVALPSDGSSSGQLTFPLQARVAAPIALEILLGVPGAKGDTGLPGSGGGALTAPAGETLSGHRAVVLRADGAAIYADNTVLAHIGRIAGITTGAAALGATATLVADGPLTEPSWNWTPDAPVFLGANGLLTQVMPTTGFMQVVGIALSATVLFVRPREPLKL